MKLKKLKFAYFQSYNQEIEINFEDLNENLILFSGPTGSGKTTIFDAICYALFGNMSSEEKNNDEIKSNYATNNNLCYVELTFTINQINYTIKRIPAQIGPGKQNRSIKIVASAFLDQFNLTKIDEVNQKIKELLNMNLEQFRQIVLLPQGKFQRLLMSNSDEKEKIFRSLFNTGSFLNLQVELKNKISQISSEIRTIVALIHTIIPEDLHTSDYQQLLLNLEEIKLSFNNQLEVCKKEKDYLQQQIDLYNQISITNQTLIEKKQLLNQLSSQNITELQTIVNQFETYRYLFPIESQLENKKIEYRSSLKEKNKIEAQIDIQNEIYKKTDIVLSNLKNQENEYQNIKQQILILNEQLSKYEGYELLKKQYEELTFELDQIQLVDENKSNQIIHNLSIELEKIQTVKNELLSLESQKKKYNLEKDKIIPLHIIKDYQQNQQHYQVLLTQFNHSSQNLNIQLENLNQLKNNYYNSIAGSLAETLKPNTPCPVCGSLHHPTLAQKQDLVKKEDVEIQEKIYQEAYANYTKIEIDLKNITDFLSKYSLEEITDSKTLHQQLESEINTIDSIIKNKQLVISQESELSHQLLLKKEELRKIQANNKIKLEKHLNYRLKIMAISSKLEEFSFDMNKDLLIDKIKENQAKNDEYEHIKKENQEILTKTIANIELLQENLSKLDKKIENLLTEINSINNQINHDITTKQLIRPSINEEEYLKYRNQITIYQTTYDSLTNEVMQLQEKIENYPEINTTLAQLKESYHQKNENYTTLQSEYLKYSDLISKVSYSINEYHKFNEEFTIYKELLDVASGDINKNSNISFERFVLGYYLDRVLILANHRLKKMSEDRYHFERKTDYKGRGKKGLELSIFDHYNGYSRSVSTLSGGESFQASLALSLGLSDYLSQKSTANHIDFLFIDEGFGSLDAESLDTAINTLIEICDGGKSIGIISHVEELKNRIPTQVQIQKSKQGSTIFIQK